MKKLGGAKPRGVKRVSSTPAAVRPTQEVVEDAPETAENMTAEVSATPADARGTPVTGRVVLPPACTIHEAQAIRAQLLEQAAHPGPYEIDGGAVQQVDTAGVQLVVAFALDCLERNVHYIWTSRSAALDEAIRMLGVGALLESPGGA